MPNKDDQLQQQYQEILNKYASSLTPPPEPPASEPVSETIPEPETQPELMLETPVEPVLPPTPTLSPEPEPESLILPTPPVEQPKENIVPPLYFPPEPEAPKSSNFFKYLFYFSIVAFIAVAIAVIYNLTNPQPTPTASDETPTPTTSADAQFCELGDKKFAVNESVPSEDGCNTCICGSDLTVACTEKACVTPEPTAKSVGKIYKDIKYGYQFECPISAKYVVEATSVNGNKIPFKQESCTDGESVATVSVYDNTVVHDFGDLKTKTSPDEKYIVTFEGDTTNVFSSFEFL